MTRIASLTAWWIDKPSEDPNIRGDAFKTLFVARLSYDAETKDLEREFGRYGPIERVRMHRYAFPKEVYLTVSRFVS